LLCRLKPEIILLSLNLIREQNVLYKDYQMLVNVHHKSCSSYNYVIFIVFLFTIHKYCTTNHIHANPKKGMSVLPSTDRMESQGSPTKTSATLLQNPKNFHFLCSFTNFTSLKTIFLQFINTHSTFTSQTEVLTLDSIYSLNETSNLTQLGSSLHTYLFTSEDNGFSASQEIPCILCNLTVHHHFYKYPPPVPILSQINPDHAPPPIPLP